MSLLPLLIVAVAHAPLLIVYFQQLWDRPHYQFFPLVLLASGYFLWQRWPMRHPPGRLLLLLSYVLLPIAAALLAFGFLRLSPMFAYISFVLIVGSLLLRLGVPALGPWLLLLLAVRIPYGQDVALIQWMQRLTTQLSSEALEKVGIEHIADGNVLLFPTTSLFVEEACSGVVSLLAIVACAGILAVWWRRAIVHSLLLIACSVFLAGAMNVIRIFTIAMALDRLDVNLAIGWRHDLLGLCIFAVSLVALFSVDRLLYFVLSPIPLNPLATYFHDAQGNILVRLWNRYVGLEEAESGADADVAYRDDDEQAMVSPPAPIHQRALGWAWDWALAVGFVLLGWGQVMAGIGPFSAAPEISGAALDLSEEDLPAAWAGWNRVGFETQERNSSSAFGEHSRIWAYRQGSTTVRISLDFVFPEWHALTACYSGVGWTLQSQGRRDAPTGSAFVEDVFSKPDGEWAILLFDLFDDEGRPYEAPSGSFVHPKLRRIFGGESSRWNLPNYYQVQALIVTDSDLLSPAERTAVRELFQWFRQQMIEQVSKDSGPASAAPSGELRDVSTIRQTAITTSTARHTGGSAFAIR